MEPPENSQLPESFLPPEGERHFDNQFLVDVLSFGWVNILLSHGGEAGSLSSVKTTGCMWVGEFHRCGER